MSDAPQRPIASSQSTTAGSRHRARGAALRAAERLERPVSDYFDVIAGTSTGEIMKKRRVSIAPSAVSTNARERCRLLGALPRTFSSSSTRFSSDASTEG